jgi:hypothetical protein
MPAFLKDEIVRLADHLEEDELEEVVSELQARLKKRKLTPEEFEAWLDSLVVDVGGILPGYSDRREDWYGDDGR